MAATINPTGATKITVSTTWRNYTSGKLPHEHTVVGELRLLKSLWSPQLRNLRDILVYLPPSYHFGDWRYPVIYMHDGQNLFDAHTSFAGEWQVDETMAQLGREGVEAIIVGVPHANLHRLAEYSPFIDFSLGGGQGDHYLEFLVNTVKPLVDAEFRTLRHRTYTGLLGSSMGGLISLYGFFQQPDVFGFAGVMSPSFWFANGAIFPYVERAKFSPGRLYLDAGTREYADTGGSPAERRRKSYHYTLSIRRMRDLLADKGYTAGKTLRYVEEKNAQHGEAAWARRLPDALRFLLKAP